MNDLRAIYRPVLEAITGPLEYQLKGDTSGFRDWVFCQGSHMGDAATVESLFETSMHHWIRLEVTERLPWVEEERKQLISMAKKLGRTLADSLEGPELKTDAVLAFTPHTTDVEGYELVENRSALEALSEQNTLLTEAIDHPEIVYDLIPQELKERCLAVLRGALPCS